MSKYALAAAVFLLGACSDSHPVLGPPPDLATAYCEYVARCDDFTFASLGGTTARCLDVLAGPACNSARTIDLTLAGPDADACATAMRNASCEHLWMSGYVRPNLCERVEAPIATEGRSCVAATCAAGLDCGGASDCPTCQPRLSAGEACDDVQAGARFCGQDLRCIDGRCVPPRGVGGPCATRRDCASNSCEEARCVEPRPLGAACERPSQCGDHRCSPEGVCVAWEGVGLNEACSPSIACRGNLECLDGRCVVSSGACDGAVTGECACPDDQGCAFGSSVCQARVPPGAACTPDGAPCALGHRCDEESNICLALPGDLEACTRGGWCAEGTFCDSADWVCRAPKPDGQPCRHAAQCESGECWRERCGPAECPP